MLVLKKKLKKPIKIALIIIGILFILFCILVGFAIHDLNKQETILDKEVQEIQNIMYATEFDEEAFKNKLNNTVSSGDYYKVERAYKNYLKDYYKEVVEIKDFFNNLENIYDTLSEDTIKKDGKDFINTKMELRSYKQTADKLTEDYNNFFEIDKALTYLDNNLDSMYIDYYKKIISSNSKSKTEQEILKYLSDSSTLINNVINIFNFLSDNKNHWQFENSKIYFDSQELYDKYSNLINNIDNVENNIGNI